MGGAALAGALLTASIPPFGFWPLAFLGIAALDRLIEDRGVRRRFATGFVAGMVLYGVTFFWMRDFTLPGYAIAALVQCALLGAGLAATPPGPWRRLALPGAVTLVEAVRWVFPFGGVPLSNLALGQVGGPLAPTTRLGGSLLLIAATAAVGTAVAALSTRDRRPAVVAAVLAVGVALAGTVAPDGSRTGELRAALVQGGGPLGTRATETDERVVFERHLDASARIDTPVDLVLWPEDVVDVEGDVIDTPEGDEIASLARRLRTTVVAGVVEGAGDRFRNSAVAWGPEGEIVDRFLKVHRVPFGEYIPFRSLLDAVADLSVIPRDAVAGEGPGVLRTPAGTFGVVISWELFFADRARSGVLRDGALLLGPTNASSYRTTLVAAQEVAAAQLRSLETGRWTLLAAPTGFSGVIDHRGTVVTRTAQRERAVIQEDVQLRRGQTLATRVGRLPVVALAAAAVGAAWVMSARAENGRLRPRRAG